jgi:hypothetical protein
VSAALSLLLVDDSAAAIERRLARVAASSPPDGLLEVVVVDRSPGHAASAIASRFKGRLPVTVLPQGPASLAAGGNLAVFGASAPFLLFLDPAVEPNADLYAAHLAAHGRSGEAQAAIIGSVSAGEGDVIARGVLGDRPRLFSFGWPQPAAPVRGAVWGGSVSVRRETLIRLGLFDALGRPGFEDVELAWRLAERPLRPGFVAEAHGRLAAPLAIDDLIARAIRLGLQESVHRPPGRRSLAARLGRPADWIDRRKMRALGAEQLYAAARDRAVPANGQDAGRAVRAALYAAWREGRSEAIRRQSGQPSR